MICTNDMYSNDDNNSGCDQLLITPTTFVMCLKALPSIMFFVWSLGINRASIGHQIGHQYN